MTFNKKFIEGFNKNPDISVYKSVILSEFEDCKMCIGCNDPIYYYDSRFKITKDKRLDFLGKSFRTTKKVLEIDYKLSYCEKCVNDKFSEYKDLNKSKVFNRMNNITKFAFNIPNDVCETWKSLNYSITKENLILKHGEEK